MTWRAGCGGLARRPDAATVRPRSGVRHQRRGRPVPVRLRLLRRPTERRQVDADQRAGRQQDRDRLLEAADHPACGPRHRASARRPAGDHRHPGPAQAPHAARVSGSTTWSGPPGPRSTRSGSASRPTSGSARGTPTWSASWPRCRAGRPWWPSRPSPTWLAGPRMAEHLSGDRGPGGPARRQLGPASCRCPSRGDPARRAGRRAGQPAPGGTAALPRRRGHRRARGDPGGRADPGGGPGRRSRRAAALDHRRGRGDGPARRSPGRPAAAGHLRVPDRRAGLPEGHRDRPPWQPAAGDRCGRARTRSRPCSVPRSTSTSRSRWSRSGSGTPSS